MGSTAGIKAKALGKRAKQAASELVIGKTITVQPFGRDKYKRTLAEILLPDGTIVNHTLAKDGWCWWWKTTSRLTAVWFLSPPYGF